MYDQKFMYFKYFLSDFNECNTTTHGCQQECMNEPGGYSCACYNGYQINSDNKTCSG